MINAHGAERNRVWSVEGDIWEGVVFTMTMHERFCAHCREWISVRGVVGALEWMAKHRDGDCS